MRFPKLMCVAAGILSATAAGTANAAVVFSDNFDSYGGTSIPWSGSGSWSTGNTVDLVKSGDYNITCAGGTGSCVDLSGDVAGFISRSIFLDAGDYSLSFDATGNQLNAFDGPWPKTGFTATIGGLNFNTGLLANDSNVFQTFSSNFNIATAGLYTLTFAQNAGGDNHRGSILDNVSISAAPEPSTWMMMVVGIGMICSALRRRRQSARSMLKA